MTDKQSNLKVTLLIKHFFNLYWFTLNYFQANQKNKVSFEKNFKYS